MQRMRWLGLWLVLIGVGLGVRDVRGQENVRPAPWSETWASHPLNADPSVSFPLIASEDTFIAQSQPGNNFGAASYAEIGAGRRGLIKFNLADIPTQGTLPLVGLHLAIALVDTAPGSFWMGYTGACPWQEATAAWQNANCPAPFALTTFPDTKPHWEFLDLLYPSLGLQENGYILFDTSAGPTRRFLTREAGEEWAPRLIVSYAKDTETPSIMYPGEPNGPGGAMLLSPGQEFNLSISEDTGLGRIFFERTMKSTGRSEQVVVDEPNGCAAGRYDRWQYSAFPFVDRPLGKEFRYQIWVEDCVGKASAPLVFEHLVHVARIEGASLLDFNNQPLTAGEVMRRDDRGTTDLLPAAIQYGSGQTGVFGSVSDVAEYWVNASGYPAGSDGVLEGMSDSGSPAHSRLFVPWHGFQILRAAGTQIKENESVQIPLRVPVGESVVVATTADVLGDAGFEATPSGHATVTVEDASGARSAIAQSFVDGSYPAGSSYPTFLAGQLTQWAGQPLTLTISFAPNGGPDWAMRLNEIVVSAQNPDLSVTGQSLPLPLETVRGGAPLPIAYQVGQVRATQPTTLTLDAPLPVHLSGFSVQPTDLLTTTKHVRYAWVMPKLLAGSRVLTATATIETPGNYTLDLSIANARDPYLANNQAQIQITASEHLVYLPSISAP